MLRPLDRVQVDTFLHQLPQRAQLSQESDAVLDCVEHVVNLSVRGEAADSEANGAVRGFVRVTERSEYVRRLERCGGTCGTRGERDVLQRHEERLTLDVGEGDVDAAGVVVCWVTVQRGVFHGEEAVAELLGEGGDAFSVVLLRNVSGVHQYSIDVVRVEVRQKS